MTDYASPSVVAINILRYIGDHVLESGTPIPEISGIAEAVGASSNEVADGIIEELVENRLIRMGNTLKLIGGSAIFISVTLSLEGWEKYEEEKRGGFSGNHGFIALKFNDSDLDIFVNEVVKPAVREIGYELVDMRDVARPGVIDNIMRTQIRDSAFVIADLTHDNSGAYWEAGYAEGSGKAGHLYLRKDEVRRGKHPFRHQPLHYRSLVERRSGRLPPGVDRDPAALARLELNASSAVACLAAAFAVAGKAHAHRGRHPDLREFRLLADLARDHWCMNGRRALVPGVGQRLAKGLDRVVPESAYRVSFADSAQASSA